MSGEVLSDNARQLLEAEVALQCTMQKKVSLLVGTQVVSGLAEKALDFALGQQELSNGLMEFMTGNPVSLTELKERGKKVGDLRLQRRKPQAAQCGEEPLYGDSEEGDDDDDEGDDEDQASSEGGGVSSAAGDVGGAEGLFARRGVASECGAATAVSGMDSCRKSKAPDKPSIMIIIFCKNRELFRMPLTADSKAPMSSPHMSGMSVSAVSDGGGDKKKQAALLPLYWIEGSRLWTAKTTTYAYTTHMVIATYM